MGSYSANIVQFVRSDLTVMTMKLFLCRTCQGFHLFTFHGGQLPTYFVAQL
uniref:Uncharacterized protein n=1 Tax=Anguilla anguilla TaxID=7936 RepID=A0A0E9UE71_ANGAN